MSVDIIDDIWSFLHTSVHAVEVLYARSTPDTSLDCRTKQTRIVALKDCGLTQANGFGLPSY